MNLMSLSTAVLAGVFVAAQGPTFAHAQASAFPVEEVSIADLEAAYLAGWTTARRPPSKPDRTVYSPG
jgi:hypothetical protein